MNIFQKFINIKNMDYYAFDHHTLEKKGMDCQ